MDYVSLLAGYPPGAHGSRAMYSIWVLHYLSGLHGLVRREASAFEGLKAHGVKYQAQTAGGSDMPCSGRVAVEPLPGQRLPPLVHTPTASFPPCTECPGGGRVCQAPARTPSQSPCGRGRGPIRDLKHNALEFQLPPGHPLQLQGRGPRPVRVPPGPLSC